MGTLVGVQREVSLLIYDLPRQPPQQVAAIPQAGAGRVERAQHNRGKRAALHYCDSFLTVLLGGVVFVIIDQPPDECSEIGGNESGAVIVLLIDIHDTRLALLTAFAVV